MNDNKTNLAPEELAEVFDDDDQDSSDENSADSSISEQSGGTVMPPSQKDNPENHDSESDSVEVQSMDAESKIQIDRDSNPLNESAEDKNSEPTAIAGLSNDSMKPLDLILPDLRALYQFVNWKIATRDGRKIKLPVNPQTRNLAKSDDPSTWNCFDTARQNVGGDIAGIGFVFKSGGNLLFIDIDHCLNENGEIHDPRVLDFLKYFDGRAYIEFSMSGTGIHIIARVNKPSWFFKCKSKDKKFEFYDSGRFCALTGNIYRGNTSIKKIDDENFDSFLQKHFRDVKTDFESRQKRIESNCSIQRDLNITVDDKLVEHFCSIDSRFNAAFKNGDASFWKKSDGITPDPSSRDFYVTCYLCWISNGDRAWIEEQFRKSACMADIPDRKSKPDYYIELTLNNTLQGWNGECYTGDFKSVGNKKRSALQSGSCDTDSDSKIKHHFGNFTTDIERNQSELDTVGVYFPYAPEIIKSLKIPSEFAIESNRVLDLRGKNPRTAMYAPIFISRRLVEVDSSNLKYYEIYYFENNQWKTRIIEPLTISDSKTMVARFANIEGVVNSRSAGYASDFLMEFYTLNKDNIQRVPLYTKLGWNGNKFILPTLNDGSYVIEDQSLNSIIARKGDRQVQIDLLRRISKHPFAELMADANFAAPLLEKIGCRNFIINFVCKSGSGKTTALRLASSLAGSPEWLVTFNGTANAIENAFAVKNSLCTNIDEFQMVSKKNWDEVANQIIHRFSEGAGKARMNKELKSREIKRYRGIMLATSENPITSETVLLGLKRRCLTFHVDYFLNYRDGSLETLDKELCDDINDFVETDYGYLLPEFIDNVQKEFRDDQKYSRLKTEFKEFRRILRQSRASDPSLDDYYDYLSAIACAHYYRNIFFFEMSRDESLAETLNYISQFVAVLPSSNELSDAERAKNAIAEWFPLYQQHFTPYTPKDLNGSHKQVDGIPHTGENSDGAFNIPKITKDPEYGFWDGDELWMYTGALKTILKNLGFNPEQIFREWQNRKIADVRNEKGHWGYRKTHPQTKTRVRAIPLDFIHIPEEVPDTSTSDLEDVPDEQIPF